MSDNSLPDEIISEILSPALKVSDELFSDNSGVSPFATNSESTSAYLLVCKSWLRVATPLLYNVVVLRSKAQAKALSLALSQNPDLGRFIKKLRVEGGYGPPMRIILQCAPNITDLFLSLVIYSSDNTSGLCKGLPLINPTRLILRDLIHRPLENKMISQLTEALIQSLSKWDRLCVLELPYIYDSDRCTKVIRPLLKSNRLHTLTIPEATSLSWVYSTFKGCPLKAIHIKEPLTRWDRIDKTDPLLMALLKYAEAPARGTAGVPEPTSDFPLIPPSLNPFFVPMANAPEEVQDKIWAHVLYFAMSVPERTTDSALRAVSRRLPLLLVSKTFARLGQPHYYTRIALKDSSAAPKFASVLCSNPSIGPRIRNLTIDYWEFPGEEETTEIDSTLLSHTTGLVRLSQPVGDHTDSWTSHMEARIPWDAFETVAKSSGPTLQEFSVRIKTAEPTSPTVFSDLVSLEILGWKCRTSFLLTDVPEDGLQNLKDLRISSADQSFLTVLSLMKLDSLQRLTLSGNDLNSEVFLKAHGPKLTEILVPYYTKLKVKMFKLCPNLRSVTLDRMQMGDIPLVDDLDPAQALPSLVKITLNQNYWTSDKNRIAQWDAFFVKFEPKRLPNLREIEFNCCVWPTTERDISKSYWVRWAEILLKRGINLTDKNGTKWRPRLKVR
ncbi:hypothetical protein C8R45DRAFT_955864 [Mycena sanguinolenta]|nr:hypothetical protein C8R45DRAFT_955864 [Mycena sanguinolenta]